MQTVQTVQQQLKRLQYLCFKEFQFKRKNNEDDWGSDEDGDDDYGEKEKFTEHKNLI